jgi:hypothetical protein
MFWRFLGFMELFSLRKIHKICPPASAHGSTEFIKRWPLATGSTARIKSIESVSLLGCLDPIWCWVAIGSSQPMQESPGADSTAEVVGFWCGLLLLDHSDEGNVFMLTLIGGERQRNPATVRQLSRCLSTVRVASDETSAPRTCAKAFLSSLQLLDWPIAPIEDAKLEFGSYLWFGGFLTCSRKFALYAALYIGVFR